MGIPRGTLAWCEPGALRTGRAFPSGRASYGKELQGGHPTRAPPVQLPLAYRSQSALGLAESEFRGGIEEGGRSVAGWGRLGRLMPSQRRRPPHPLLLEQEYWRNRLQALRLARPSALYTPRQDLSSRSVRVEEFRVRAHDGLRLCGLVGKRAMVIGKSQVRLRILPADQPPEIDLPAVRSGMIEYALQLPAGRRLEDRVLDVLRVCELAASRENVRRREVLLFVADGEVEPDEFLIASQLMAGEIGPELQ